MLVFFFSFFSFVTSSRRSNLGSISLFCPIFDAMFSRHDIIPPPPHASTV
jgi:hypothetical protein